MTYTFALVGNPNVGKTAVFNALTGLSQTTGNYPGVTVACARGRVRHAGHTLDVVDLPGAYSLAARSPDEMIVADTLLGQQAGAPAIDAILAVVDASNLQRNLYFVSQLLEVEKPLVIALNMMDVAEARGIQIDTEKLGQALGAKVVPVRAHRRIGFDALKDAMAQLAAQNAQQVCPVERTPLHRIPAVEDLLADLEARRDRLGRIVPPLEAYRVLVDKEGYAERRLVRILGPEFSEKVAARRAQAQTNGASLAAQEAGARYAWVREIIARVVQTPTARREHATEYIDRILTHRVLGSVIFTGLMLLVFQSIFTWAGPAMDLIDGSVAAAGGWVGDRMPEGVLRSMVVDGIFAGVGGVLVFLPQILLLSLFIALLEDCGYMARAAFLMDKLFSWCGLSGQSFIPMLSSFACAVPGIAATRTIAGRKDRFTTILIAPLMSCSARLPVYVIMIAAFVPSVEVAGIFNLQGLTLAGMYLVGLVVAIPVALVLKTTLLRGERVPFLLEMPSYKLPEPRSVAMKVYREGREFLVRAGTLIFAISIVIWALAYFPRSAEIEAQAAAQIAAAESAGLDEEALAARLDEINHDIEGAYLEDSYLGRMGHAVEPVFAPLGWDWRIATATIASFPAREVIIATLGTLFHLGPEVDAESEGLKNRLMQATWPDGRPLFNLPVALSIMVFFALCAQCAATLAAIQRETGHWRWPLLTFTYMTVLAYVCALATYQVSMAIGLGA